MTEIFYHSEGHQHNNIYKAEACTNEPLIADLSAPIPVIQNTQGRQLNLKNTFKDTAAQKKSG